MAQEYTLQELDQAYESAKAAQNMPAMQEIDALRKSARQQYQQSGAGVVSQIYAQQEKPVAKPKQSVRQQMDNMLSNVKSPLEALGGLKSAFTGEANMTPRAQSAQEIGAMPELNQANMAAFKSSLVTALESDPVKAARALRANLPNAQFTADEKGNVYVRSAVDGKDYIINRPGFSGQDLLQLAVGAGAFTPAGRAAAAPAMTVGKRAAVGAVGSAATQAAIEGAKVGAGGEVTPENITLSGLIGGAMPFVGGIVDKGRQVLQAARADLPAIAPDVARLLQTAEKAGIPLKTTNIIQPKTWAGQRAQQIGEAIPVIGTGGISGQQAQKSEEAIANIAKQYAADLDDPSIIYGVAKSLESAKRARIAEQNSRVNRIIGQAEKNAEGAQIEFPSLPGFVQQRRQQELALGSKADPKILDTLDNIEADVANLTPKTLEAYRKRLGEGFKNDMGVTPDSLQRFESALYGVLRQDQGAYIKKYAGDAAFNEWKVANNAISNTLRNQQTAGIANMLNKGEISPDAAFAAIVNAKDFKSKALYNALDDKGRSLAQSAIINNAVMKATNREGLIEGVKVSVPQFVSTLQQSLPQIRVFFRGADRQQLEGLIRVLDMTKTAGANIKTGYVGVPMSAGGLAALLGTGSPWGGVIAAGAAGTASGLASRVYESPAVRDLLIKLAKTPKGGTAERVIGGRVAAIVNASANANREQEQPQEQQGVMQ